MTPSPQVPVARPLARPRPSALLGSDLLIVVDVFLALIVAMWARHGGLHALSQGWFAAWGSVSSLTGLLASGCGLVGVVLVARPRTLERHVGLDRMFVWHRYLGESMAVLVGVHIVAAVIAGMSFDTSIWTVLRDYTGRESYMAMAAIGGFLVLLVTITSLRSMRQQMSYESWYFVHLLAYGGLALSFSHEITLGTDFADDKVARWFWVGLHVAVLVAVIVGRWGRTIRSIFRPLKVLGVTRLGSDISALYLGGKSIRAMEATAGQFCILRPLIRGQWWQAHPFSLSAAPTTGGLRFTIKDRGDASQIVNRLPAGTRVAVEGPYGVATPEAADGKKVLCIVGGVGVAPARAMIEMLTPQQQPIVLYRARNHDDLVHLDEMQEICSHVEGEVLTLVGPSISLAVKDPFGAASLLRTVPDLVDRSVFVCGPDSLVHAARKGLKAAGVPAENVHFEMVWW